MGGSVKKKMKSKDEFLTSKRPSRELSDLLRLLISERKKQQITQVQLADKIGLVRNYVCRLEKQFEMKEPQKVTVNILERYAKALGYDLVLDLVEE
jgi:transcriptional regulator with XRE-family HTH domain